MLARGRRIHDRTCRKLGPCRVPVAEAPGTLAEDEQVVSGLVARVDLGHFVQAVGDAVPRPIS